jgi:thiamine-phosphate pyrophosphorylase
MVMNRVDWRLCFIADAEVAAGWDVLQLIGEAVAGGATLIQIRGKNWTGRELLEAGIQAVQLLRPKKIPLIINDRPDIALACEADGVHLGQDDMPLPYARKILGKKRIIGISTKTAEEAVAAERDGADYIGVGPIFKTLSKEDSGPEVGLARLRKVRANVKIPILAIGGISAANLADVIAAGADGVAVISAIAVADNPSQAAAEIIELIEKIKNRR